MALRAGHYKKGGLLVYLETSRGLRLFWRPLMPKRPSAVVIHKRRWVRNGELARYLGVSKMTLWRFKKDPELKFPPASLINGIEFNDLDKVDPWMEAHVAE